jgi:uncharacterized membrane protein YdjX (TVP38/TMEM64 family)
VKIPLWLRGCVLVLVLLVVLWVRTQVEITPTSVRETVLSYGVWAPVIYVLLYAIRPFFFFPASLFSLTGGLAFGALPGGIYILIGATLSALSAFWTARFLGRSAVERLLRGKGAWLDQQIAREGFIVVVILRVIPVVPFDAISVAAGISRIRVLPYTLATVVGILPGTLVYSYLGSSLLQGWQQLTVAIVLFAAFLSLTWLLRSKVKHWLKQDES